MVVSDIAIRRPVFAIVVSLLLIVLGLFAFMELSVREYPDVDRPVVSISTSYSGASAQVIETQITQVVEEAVAGIQGIDTITSSSRAGSSRVRLEFGLGKSIDEATNDIRDAVGRVSRSLPDEADAPVIRKSDNDASPILWATITSDRRDALELTDYANRFIVDRVATVPGVAQVRLGGEREYSMRIWLDRNAMAARSITVSDIEEALEAENVELPAGRVESEQREFTVRTDTRLQTAEEFRNLVIARQDGYLVRLGEVAEVEVAPRDERGAFQVNGVDAIGLGVTRQSTANTLDVSAGVRQALEDVRVNLPDDIRIEISSDDSVFIEQSIYEVFHALGIALALVVAVVFVFLRRLSATLIPIVTVPISITASFMVLAAMGYSINVLTLLAFVLAIGLVVDDAIIVLENISRRIDLGETPLVASFLGARQIGFAVIATTMVLCAVFVPISFLDGDVGRLFSEFGISVAAAVLFSSVVALTLTPMMCSRLLRPASAEGRFHGATGCVFDGMTSLYGRLLRHALDAPLIVLGIAVALSAGAFLLLVELPKEFAPTEDRGSMYISATAPEGATLDYTAAEAERIQAILRPYIESGDLRSVLSILSPGFGGTGVNRAIFIGRLKPWDERTVTQQEIVTRLNAELSEIPGIRATAINPGGLGRRGTNSPVRFVLGGSTYEELQAWTDDLLAHFATSTNVTNLSSDYDETKPELRVSIDRQRAADLGISIRDIGETLETMFGSRTVTRYVQGGEEYDVVLQAQDSDRASPRDLSNVFVRAESGTLVPLINLITLTDAAGPTELNRYNRLRSITISGSLAPGATLDEAIAEVEQAVRELLPAHAQLFFEGESREFLESSASLYITFAIAFLIVFLVLAAQFESFVHPVIILLTVPLAIFGALGSVALLGLNVNIYTQIGMVMLIGLVAKNAILIVEFANQLRDEGRSIREAVAEASATRLRPILMTSIATAFGALPLALATGAGAESRQAIGIIVVGGVSFSTLMAIFVVPVLYDLLAGFTRPAGATAAKLRAELHGHPAE
ncbi:efflux RND transporter permease subunit [Inquilinus sp. CAU 1745]|uniref:efflux RND transporter permease subunit n=1 Tax=Inquilinus sp. CAU 1745 TaxID=3140369 RepID=UPI00325A66D7